MRKGWSMVLVVVLVALGLGVSAQAGGKGAMKVGLFVGYYPTSGPSEIQEDPLVQVGHVVFAQTGNGKMHVTIHLQDALPDTVFPEAFVVPLAVWDMTTTDYSMTTNGQGKATLQFSVAMPEEEPDPFYIKVVVRENEREGVIYVTDRHEVVPKK